MLYFAEKILIIMKKIVFMLVLVTLLVVGCQEPNDPLANFTYDKEFYIEDDTAYFKNQSLDAQSYLWQFHNNLFDLEGEQFSDKNVSYYYDLPRTYEVTLTAFSDYYRPFVFDKERKSDKYSLSIEVRTTTYRDYHGVWSGIKTENGISEDYTFVIEAEQFTRNLVIRDLIDVSGLYTEENDGIFVIDGDGGYGDYPNHLFDFAGTGYLIGDTIHINFTADAVNFSDFYDVEFVGSRISK